MTGSAPGSGDTGHLLVRDEADVRLDFGSTGNAVWIELVDLLGIRWETTSLGHLAAGRIVRRLSGLMKLRCRPDARPLPASAVLECLLRGVSPPRAHPVEVVEGMLVRGLAGEALSGRTAAEIAALIEAFLRCFAADYERGELTWVDEVHAMVRSGEPQACWTMDLPRLLPAEDGAVVPLSIPLAALDAAGLREGDRLVIEPRSGGLWVARLS